MLCSSSPRGCRVVADTENASEGYLFNKKRVMDVLPAPDGAVIMITLFTCME